MCELYLVDCEAAVFCYLVVGRTSAQVPCFVEEPAFVEAFVAPGVHFSQVLLSKLQIEGF